MGARRLFSRVSRELARVLAAIGAGATRAEVGRGQSDGSAKPLVVLIFRRFVRLIGNQRQGTKRPEIGPTGGYPGFCARATPRPHGSVLCRGLGVFGKKRNFNFVQQGVGV